MNEIGLGLDIQGSLTHLAIVDPQSGRPEVRDLQTTPADSDLSAVCREASRITLAVPDSEAMVKHLRLAGRDPGPIEHRLRYELSSSVLEPESSFLLDFHPVDNNEHFLGFIFRRERLTLLATRSAGKNLPIQYRLRAMALARGYQTFCRQDDGLVCLADVTSTSVSICFVYGTRIVDVAHLNTGGRGLDGVADQEQLAVDLKTVVSYRLTEITDRGISLPLSSLIVSGVDGDHRVRDTLQRYFSIPVGAPAVNPAYMGDIRVENRPVHAYLVALGLTVN
ncbi:MAG: hypothetical protein KKA42_10655 [candidate division Zixibacteria bacterium]|nr:hypothetical protein [candidate division Zixibacteria bacterium]